MLASVPPHVDADDDGDQLNVQFEQFIDEHMRKAYLDAYEEMRALALDNARFNMYTEPAVALGVALAYALLTDRGGAR